MERNKVLRLLGWMAARLDVVYKLLLLAALLWIGLGLQDVTDAIYAIGDSCGSDYDGATVSWHWRQAAPL